MSSRSRFEDAVLDIIKEEGTLLQSDIKPKLKDEYDWADEEYKDTSISSNVSRIVRMFEQAGIVELEAGHQPSGGQGRPTHKVTYTGGDTDDT